LLDPYDVALLRVDGEGELDVYYTVDLVNVAGVHREPGPTAPSGEAEEIGHCVPSTQRHDVHPWGHDILSGSVTEGQRSS
jgi:hypothetical protein